MVDRTTDVKQDPKNISKKFLKLPIANKLWDIIEEDLRLKETQSVFHESGFENINFLKLLCQITNVN